MVLHFFSVFPFIFEYVFVFYLYNCRGWIFPMFAKRASALTIVCALCTLDETWASLWLACNRNACFVPVSLRSTYFYLFELLIILLLFVHECVSAFSSCVSESIWFSAYYTSTTTQWTSAHTTNSYVLLVNFVFYRKKVLKVEQWCALIVTFCTLIRIRYQFYCDAAQWNRTRSRSEMSVANDHGFRLILLYSHRRKEEKTTSGLFGKQIHRK